MTSISVTFTTPASGPFNVLKLLQGNTYSGAVTITPTPATGPPVVPAPPPRIAAQLFLKGDDGNTTNFVYVGDLNLTPASTDTGTRLAAGISLPPMVNVPLAGVFVNGSTGSPVMKIIAQGGFQ
jgi:hypothetical protein